MTNGRDIPVFVGPSLPPAARPQGPFRWMPPARAGDVAQLLAQPPERFCLIDGLFDSCPAPWHKELLMLMARGTVIFGASSMGALRAAELSNFGMIGVGAIYQAYADNRLSGDDEVALIHADDRLDWAPLTIPMVEMRATLLRACRTRLIDIGAARRLRTLARAIHFSDRDWPLVARAATRQGLVDQMTMQKLEAIHVPLKRWDALACLEQAVKPDPIARRCAAPPLTCFVREMLGPDITA